MEDITKIVKYFQYSTFLITRVIQTTNNGVKEQRGGFLGMLLRMSGKRCENMSLRLIKANKLKRTHSPYTVTKSNPRMYTTIRAEHDF